LNNLKQMGLALHSHLEAKNAFPVGAPNGNANANWRVHLLPFMDQQSVYDQLNLAQTFNGQDTSSTSVNRTVLTKLMFSVYHCPTTTLDPFPSDVSSNTQNKWPNQVPTYVGIAGAGDDPAGRTLGFTCTNTGSNVAGVFAGTGLLTYFEAVSASKCPDGLSNTMIVGEQSGLLHANAGVNADGRSRYLGGFSGSPIPANPVSKWSCGTAGSASLDVWSMSVTTVKYKLNYKEPSPAVPTGAGQNGSNTVLNSMHPGAVNILMGDGSSRTMADAVDMTIVMKLSSRNDGKGLPADF
jgi:prepilin-type processing-associated H-X9-DG protein